ncbi:unnamed protein product [Effrenium voratum]|nr:unnamed protein product [Effrenium voratum]CAJ1456870.1 unnamed protein product [Effrenium voratum]
MPPSKLLKRPAAAVDGGKSVSKKRPAAAASGAINLAVTSLRKGMASPDDEDNYESDGRDKGKAIKYAKMKSELPHHIVDLVENESRKSAHPRDAKTQAINRLFRRMPGGRLELNVQDRLFTEHQKLYTKRYGRKEDTSLPESIMKGLYFNNSDSAFENAKAKGEIHEVRGEDGKPYWSFKSFVAGQETGTDNSQIITGSKKITQKHGDLFCEALARMEWKFELKDKDVAAFGSKKKLPEPAAGLVKQALDAQDKLSKEGLRLIKKWNGSSDDEHLVKLKKGYASCLRFTGQLQHIREFHEIEGAETTYANFQKLMLEIATATEAYNTDIELFKGKIKARQN